MKIIEYQSSQPPLKKRFLNTGVCSECGKGATLQLETGDSIIRHTVKDDFVTGIIARIKIERCECDDRPESIQPDGRWSRELLSDRKI